MKTGIHIHCLNNGAVIKHKRRFAWFPKLIMKYTSEDAEIRWLCFYWEHSAKSSFGIHVFANTRYFVFLNPPTIYTN